MWNVEHHAEAVVVSSKSPFTGKGTIKAVRKKTYVLISVGKIWSQRREKAEDNIRQCFEDVNTNVK